MSTTDLTHRVGLMTRRAFLKLFTLILPPAVLSYLYPNPASFAQRATQVSGLTPLDPAYCLPPFQITFPQANGRFQGTSPDQQIPLVGEWRLIGDTNASQVIAVHAALLHTGSILFLSGDETDFQYHNQRNYDHTRLFDCRTYTVQVCASPTTDVFCGGHAMLADGRVVVAGGIQDGILERSFWDHNGQHNNHPLGSRSAWVFEPRRSQWTQLPDMIEGPLAVGQTDRSKTGGRWYPTLVTLPSGELLTLSGHPGDADARHHNNTPEVFVPTPDGAGVWLPMPAVGSSALDPFMFTYPRLYLLPSGRIFSASPLDERGYSHWYDAVGGTLADACPAPIDPQDPQHEHIYWGFHATSVLLPLAPENNYQARALLCGGQQPYIIDADDPTPAWRATGARVLDGSPTRWNVNAVLLPTGEVFVCGGVRRTENDLLDTNAVLTPELYDPATDRWFTLPPASVPRNYHSVALLMPDGRVWTAGSNYNAFLGVNVGERRIEIFDPWYTRPTIQRPKILVYPPTVRIGQTFELRCPGAASIRRVALIRTGSVTHSFNADQRYIGLAFQVVDDERLVVTAPPSATIAPPGYYLLFVVDADGVPSEGQFVRIPVIPHWTRWFRLSGEQITPSFGRVSAVSSVPGGVSLFTVDANGVVQSSYYDPRVPNPQWSSWFPLSGPGLAPGGAVVSAVSSVEGGISLFLVDQQGAVQSSYYDPRVANPQWSAWFPLSEPELTSPGAVVSAVSSVPGGISLFVVDRDGTVRSSYYDPRVANPQWSPWFGLNPAEIASPGAVVSVVSSVPGGISLFVIDRSGAAQSCYYDPRVANPAWTDWFPLSEPGLAASSATISAVSSVPGGVSLYLVDPLGAVQSCYYDPRVPNPAWSSWFPLSETDKTAPNSVVSAVSTVPGGVSLFVVDLEGAVQSSFYDPRMTNPQWSPWFRLSEVGKAAPPAVVNAVSSVPGGTSLFVLDRQLAVQTAYFDPREPTNTDTPYNLHLPLIQKAQK